MKKKNKLLIKGQLFIKSPNTGYLVPQKRNHKYLHFLNSPFEILKNKWLRALARSHVK